MTENSKWLFLCVFSSIISLVGSALFYVGFANSSISAFDGQPCSFKIGERNNLSFKLFMTGFFLLSFGVFLHICNCCVLTTVKLANTRTRLGSNDQTEIITLPENTESQEQQTQIELTPLGVEIRNSEEERNFYLQQRNFST